MSADPRRLKDLFGSAAAIADPAERAAYLDRECNDADLRRRLDALLRAHDRPESALERPLAVPDPNRTVDRPSAAVGSIIAGRYKLLEAIGEGGMGEVWVADQLEPVKRRVALKMIKPGMDSRSILARFEAERQALAMMDHPNIAKVFDASTTEDGRPYFVMELVKGTPITEFCDARKLGFRERLELFVPVCQAIQHAHMKGIIHRDIKPTNVLVALHDEVPVAKVIDFGVAKAIGQQLTDKTLYTGFGTLVGTPAYMAPEQATFNQLDIDTRADVYALGVLLYELLAGSPPIEKERLKLAALDEVLRIVRDEEPQRPSQRLSTSQAKATIAATRKSDAAKLSQLMKGELDWIVMKALEKDRTRRYDTANGLAKDVQRYLAGDAVEACPPTLAYRMRKAYRRNKAAVWVAAAFLALSYAGATAIYFAYGRAVRAETAAKDKAVEAAQNATLSEQFAVAAGNAARIATREQKRAEEEKRSAEAVRSFLQNDLLQQASLLVQANTLSPQGGDFDIKPNPTIHELLDRAAAQLTREKIEAKFPNLPFVQAEVLHAVANAYDGIGEFAKAMALIDRAVPLYLAARGPDDRATLTARVLQSLVHLSLGRRAKGEELLSTVIADLHRAFGPRDRITFDAQIWYGRSRTIGGHADEAIPFFQKLKAAGTEYYGASDTLTLLAAGHLAMAYRTNRQLTEAVKEMESLRAVALSVKIRPDHPMLDAAFGELAEAYRLQNRRDDAIRVWKELLDVWAARGDPYHRSTWNARHESAWLLARKGDPEAAATLFEANLKAADVPVKKLLSYGGLQQMEQRLGRDDSALTHARQALDVMFAGHDPTYRNWYTGLARLRLGELLLKKKTYGEAEEYLKAAVQDLVDFHGKRPHYDQGGAALEAHRAIVNLYKATGRKEAANRAMTDFWVALERQSQPGDVAKWSPRHGMAWEAFNSGDHETAAKLFEMNVKAAATPEDKSRSYHGLQESEQKLGRTDAAREHARAAVDAIVAARGPDHRSYLLGSARSSFGLLLYSQKRFDEAEPHLIAGCREVADYVHQIPDYDYPHRHVPFDALVDLLEKSSRPTEAKKWSATKAELIEKLLRKSLAVGDKLTSASVALAGQLVWEHIVADRPDAALALYRELNEKYPAADQPTAEAWLRVSGNAFNTYESKLQFDRMKPWAELRIPAVKRELDSLRKSKAPELALLRATNTAAFTYLHAGRHADVIKLVEEALARQKANGWRTDPEIVPSYGSLCKAATLAGRPELGTEIATAILAELQKKPNVSKNSLAYATFSLGFAKSHTGAHAEAEAHFRNALRFQTEENAKHWSVAKYKAWIGFALYDRKNYAAAEPVLLEAHAEFVQRLAATPTWEKQHPLLIAERLASLYGATNQPEKAAAWKAKRGKP